MRSFSPTVIALVCAAATAQASKVGADDIESAVKRNDLVAVRAMLDANPEVVRTPGRDKETPLHIAANSGLAEMAALLVERGADVNAVAYNGFTPLHLTDSAEVVRVLLKAGVDAGKKDSWGKTPLQNAIQTERVAVADALIESGVKIDLVSALMLKKRDLVKKLIAEDPGAAASKSHESDLWGNTTPLGIAAGQGDVEIVELLLKAGADANAGTFLATAGGDATPLCNAIWGRHIEVVRLLLDKGAGTHGSGGKYYDSIFDFAVHNSDAKIVELMLEHGALTAEGQAGFAMRRSPLSIAARNGDVEKVKLLLKHGHDYFIEEDKRRALFAAAYSQRLEVVKLLRDEGAPSDIFTSAVLGEEDEVVKRIEKDHNTLDSHDPVMKRSLLSWAIVAGRQKLAVTLMDRGANVNDKTERSVTDDVLWEGTPRPGFNGAGGYAQITETPLLVAVGAYDGGRITSPNADMVHRLLDKGADPNVAGWTGTTPLLAAVGAKDAALVEDLLKHGANPKTADEHGGTPLHAAAESKEVAEALLNHGADPSAIGYSGTTPLDSAIWRPESGVSELLLERGAKLTVFSACVLGKAEFLREEMKRNPAALEADCSSQIGIPPLTVAAEHGQLEAVRALVEAGAKVNFEDHRRSTPLHAAAECGSVEVATYLLEHGANLKASSYQGTALHRAAMYGKLEMVKFLIDRGLSVNEEAEGGAWTPLEAVASWSDSAEVAEYLIAKGAEVNHRSNNSGSTALHGTASKGCSKVAKVLLDHGADRTIKDSRGMTALDWATRESGYDDAEEKQKKAELAKLLKDYPHK